MIGSLLVSQEISMRHNLCNNRSIGDQFSLDILFLNGNAEIIDLVDIVLNPAGVALKVVDFALLILSLVGHAVFGNKSLLLSPGEYLIDVATDTPK